MKKVQTFFEKDSSTFTYIVYDPDTKDAVVFDPVLNYEPNGSSYWLDEIDKIIAFVNKHHLRLHYSIDTHAHADHISGSAQLKKVYPTLQTAIGISVTQVQEFFASYLDLPHLQTNGSQFDFLVEDKKTFSAGSIQINPIHTPGHTPTCTCYQIDDMVFTGDVLFMPDFGTGRCDFPKGSAKDLYHSVHEKIYTLPDSTRLFVGHDYQPGGRKLAWETTVGQSKKTNIHIKSDTTQAEFITFRQARDKTLLPPRLLLQSIQINIDGGHLPVEGPNGIAYIKIPIIPKQA